MLGIKMAQYLTRGTDLTLHSETGDRVGETLNDRDAIKNQRHEKV